MLLFYVRSNTGQNKLLPYATTELSNAIGTIVTAEYVDIDFFDELILQNVIIYGNQDDTLAVLGELEVDIALFSFSDKSIAVDQIKLSQAIFNINNTTSDSNIQHIIDHLSTSPSDGLTVSDEDTAWNFALSDVVLDDIEYNYLDDGLRAIGSIASLHIDSDQVDVTSDNISIDAISIEKLIADITEIANSTSSTSAGFPTLPMSLEVGSLDLVESEVNYAPIEKDALAFSGIQISIDNIRWGRSISGELRDLTFSEKSGLASSHSYGVFQFSENGIGLYDANILTNYSNALLDADIRYDEYDDLLSFGRSLTTKGSIKEVNISKNDIALVNEMFDLKLPSTFIDDDISVKGNFESEDGVYHLYDSDITIRNKWKSSGDLSIRPATMDYSLQRAHVRTTQSYLLGFLPDVELPDFLKDQNEISLYTDAVGNDKEINFKNLTFETSENQYIAGRGMIKDFQASKGPFIDMAFDSLNIDTEKLFYPSDDLPTLIYDLGKVNFAGKYKGNLYDINVDGNLKTDLGNADLDLSANFNNDYSDASYQGYVDLDNVNLGQITQDTTFGYITAKGNIKGSGFDKTSADVILDVQVAEVDFQNEHYRDITVDGQLRDGKFKGVFNSDDEKLDINFEGETDITGDEKVIAFKSEIKQFDLQTMGVTNFPFLISGIVNGNLQGNGMDDVLGTIIIDDMIIETDVDTYQDTDRVVFSAIESDEEKTYSIRSELIDGTLVGNVKLSDLANIVEKYVRNYIPIEYGYEDQKDSLRLTDNYNFNIKIDGKNLYKIIPVILHDSIGAKEFHLDMTFNSEKEQVEFHGDMDSIHYSTFDIGHMNYDFSGSTENLSGRIKMNAIANKGDVIFTEGIIDSKFNKEKGEIDLLMKEEEKERFKFGGYISQREDLIFKFKEEFFIDEKKWMIPDYNEVSYGQEGLFISGLKLSDGSQSIDVFSDENESGKSIELLFTDFQLGEITKLIYVENDLIEGKINGYLTLNDYTNDPFLVADVGVKSIVLDSLLVGDLKIESIQDQASNMVKSRVTLFGEENDAVLDLDFGIASQKLDGNLKINKLLFSVLDPFLVGTLEENGGYLNGNVDISGTLDQPVLLGEIYTNDVVTKPVFTNVPLQISNTKIVTKNNEIVLDAFDITDQEGNTAQVDGVITHQYLDDFYLNISINTDKFLLLSTTSIDNETFWGDIKMQATANIYGPLEDVRVEGEASAIGESALYLSPFASEAGSLDSDFIIYADPRNLNKQEEGETSRGLKNELPLSVNVTLSIDEDSKFVMIMDPYSGDKLEGKGNANLNLILKKNSDILLYGDYNVTDGQYDFSYYNSNVFKREFKIQPGGTVNFNGDPLQGVLNVSAQYVAETPVYDLIRNEAADFTDAQVLDAERKRDVNVILNLKEEILTPEITMDLTNGSDDNSQVTQIFEAKLDELRNDPNLLNNQVFGLLLLNSFIVSNTSSNFIASTGANIGLSSLSGLVTQQLNNLTANLIKGVDFNFDFDSYSADYLSGGDRGLVTELGVGASYNLFDDRVTLTAGTNIDLESSSDASVFNTIAGDFLVQYRIDKKGNYSLKAFRRTSNNRLLDENSAENGIGVQVKKTFGNIKRKETEN